MRFYEWWLGRKARVRKKNALLVGRYLLFDMIRNDPDIDNPEWLREQREYYNRLLNAIDEDGDTE